MACLKSGVVKENADLVRVDPISGPGVCGAEYPLKVAALGESGAIGFADYDVRPPAPVGGQPRWPTSRPNYSQPSSYPETAVREPGYPQPSSGPMRLDAPGVAPSRDEIELPAEGSAEMEQAGMPADSGARYSPQMQSQPVQRPLPRLGPARGDPVASVGPVAIKPTATLACPIVSVLDRWLAESIQPAATRWFGSRVVEIKQISAYSCRGMNGNSRAHISEHAFGNALDIAAFTLADGRRISVKDGWHGLAEEQGFLRDVQATACQQFNTVLAPGSNVYHYDHIHVDLMRRASRRLICQPAAVSGEEVAARASSRGYANRDSSITGSIGRFFSKKKNKPADDDDDQDE